MTAQFTFPPLGAPGALFQTLANLEGEVRRAIDAAVGVLSSGVRVVGAWNAASGGFPTARPDASPIQSGDAWIVTGAGTQDNVAFDLTDRLLALTAGGGVAYASNWLRIGYSDLFDPPVAQAAGGTGAASLAAAMLAPTGAASASLANLLADRRPIFNVVRYGADPTGVADSHAAITAAIAAAAAAGGGTVYFPGATPGATYSVSATVVIDTRHISLEFEGGEGTAFNGNFRNGSASLLWAGASGGTVLRLKPATGGFNLWGNHLRGVSVDGGGTAAIGIELWNVNMNELTAFVRRCTTNCIQHRNLNQSEVLAGTVSASQHNWGLLCADQRGMGSATAAILITGSSTGDANFSLNHGVSLYTLTDTGGGVRFGCCDNNFFPMVRDVNGAAPVGVASIRFDGSNVAAPGIHARYNLIAQCLPGAAGVVAGNGTGTGTPGAQPSVGNHIIYMDQQVVGDDYTPTIETGATLTWGARGRFTANSQRLIQGTAHWLTGIDGGTGNYVIRQMDGPPVLQVTTGNGLILDGPFNFTGAEPTASPGVIAGAGAVIPGGPNAWIKVSVGGTVGWMPWWTTA